MRDGRPGDTGDPDETRKDDQSETDEDAYDRDDPTMLSSNTPFVLF